MSNTSAYGWNIPDNTDLVKDGALAIRTLGNAIDTSMNTALGTKKAGMVLLNTTSFSGVSSFSIGSDAAPLFSSLYENYLLNIYGVGTVGGVNLNFRLRANTTDASGSNYIQNEMYNTATSALATSTTTTVGKIGYVGNNSFVCQANFFRPFLSERTGYLGRTFANSTTPTLIQGSLAGEHTLSTSYNGITISTDGGNFTGKVQIYGYNF